MIFKEGRGWKACYDPDTGRYTAERGGFGGYHLYEITEEIWNKLGSSDIDDDASERLIMEGRHLYMDVNDRCGPPYTIIFDSDYKTLCSWANIICSGRVWDDDLTDAAVELFASEKQNRQQRREKRAQRLAEEAQSSKKSKKKKEKE